MNELKIASEERETPPQTKPPISISAVMDGIVVPSERVCQKRGQDAFRTTEHCGDRQIVEKKGMTQCSVDNIKNGS